MNFFAANVRWLSAGALMAGATAFGQTFFIALYAGEFRAAFSLSHGEWGAIYMIATLCSAAALTQTGRLSDHFRTRSLALIVIAAFAVVCVAAANVASAVMLAFVIFGLRFCGQGMLSHLAVTAMAKWFREGRARALAVAGLGFSLAEAALPTLALLAVAAVGWRGSWLIAAAILILVVAPLLTWLLRAERSPRAMAEEVASPGMDGRHWTRGEMARHWVFWALVPGVVGPSWIGTTVFFQVVPLTEGKGWALTDYAAFAYPVYSTVTIVASFIVGFAADRFGAARLLPVYLLGWAVACAGLAGADALWLGVLAMGAGGVASGGVSVVHGALFAELYGTRWLGGIRALAAALMVIGSALGPAASGAMLDAGIGLEAQLYGFAAYLVAVSVAFVFVAARVRAKLQASDQPLT